MNFAARYRNELELTDAVLGGRGSARRDRARPRNSTEDDQSDAKPLTEYDEGAGSDANTVYDLFSVYRSVHDKDIFEES